uniref:Uncharacterized protein n=1 Tax=Rangifer tarandus platyrhynchus TaxID=3082113 RepID=A0ACB0FJU8_RANTA|nr:unnamed protein product [Rangifer tarandus platyrhynchus]
MRILCSRWPERRKFRHAWLGRRGPCDAPPPFFPLAMSWSEARVTFQGQRWRGGRLGGVKADPGAQPTATQVWKRRRVRGQDLRGAKGMELGRTPSLDTMQGERDSYQILLQVKLAFPPSPQIEERKL